MDNRQKLELAANSSIFTLQIVQQAISFLLQRQRFDSSTVEQLRVYNDAAKNITDAMASVMKAMASDETGGDEVVALLSRCSELSDLATRCLNMELSA